MEEVYSFLPRIRERGGQLGGTLSGGEQSRCWPSDRAWSPGGELCSAPMRASWAWPGRLVRRRSSSNDRGNQQARTTILLVEQNAAERSTSPTSPTFSRWGEHTISDRRRDRQRSRVREAYLGVGEPAAL